MKWCEKVTWSVKGSHHSHRPQATQAVHSNAGAPSPAALSKCWELFRWFAFFWFCQIPESAKHYEALPSPTNSSLQQQIGFADSGIWQNQKNANQRNIDRVSLIWFANQRNHGFADTQIRWFAALRKNGGFLSSVFLWQLLLQLMHDLEIILNCFKFA